MLSFYFLWYLVGCETKGIELTRLLSSYRRSSRDEGETYTSVPIVVLTVHRAQEESQEQRSHFSYEAEDALPVSEVFGTFCGEKPYIEFFNPLDNLDKGIRQKRSGEMNCFLACLYTNSR